MKRYESYDGYIELKGFQWVVWCFIFYEAWQSYPWCVRSEHWRVEEIWKQNGFVTILSMEFVFQKFTVDFSHCDASLIFLVTFWELLQFEMISRTLMGSKSLVVSQFLCSQLRISNYVLFICWCSRCKDWWSRSEVENEKANKGDRRSLQAL